MLSWYEQLDLSQAWGKH